jgi:hypothetical protein
MNTYSKTKAMGRLLRIICFIFFEPSEIQSISRFRIPLATEELTPVSGNHGLPHGTENNGWMVEENTDSSF